MYLNHNQYLQPMIQFQTQKAGIAIPQRVLELERKQLQYTTNTRQISLTNKNSG